MGRCLALAWLPLVLLTPDGPLPDGVRDTQNPKDQPPTPQQAVELFRPQPGFKVNLFAGEPSIAQPISLDFDDRGRMWVCECFSYPDWKPEGKDRLVILTDTDGDGQADRRTVFWDQAYNLTSVLCSGTGVYVLCAPHLLFLPDRDHDDKPDGPPVVLLDGWTLKAKHNIVNGLTWGPDGWIYGCHGILADSLVGKPETPDGDRKRLNCGIWRYHPPSERFEVVCHGTTNPWGLDFDEWGEGFFTNCVIGHLWHMLPGARYQRMYGQDFNPFSYDLIEAASDHLHWGGGDWTTSRGGKGVHDDAGGGHAHSGALVYLGGSWPDAYRNSILMCNIHGNRLNRNLLVRQGNGYVGKQAADMFRADNQWFRGVALKSGPDGAVYVADWCDLGECHDNDGTHRRSGRIYRFAHETAQAFPELRNLDLQKLTDTQLVELQAHKNEWFVRHARRILAERVAGGAKTRVLHDALWRMANEERDPRIRIRALWALHATGGIGPAWLVQLLESSEEPLRVWAVRLLTQEGLDADKDRAARLGLLDALTRKAATDRSGLVRLYLAAACQRLPLKERLPILEALALHAEDAEDRCQPLMIWYALEPCAVVDPVWAVDLADRCRIPRLRRWIARRQAEAAVQGDFDLGPLLKLVAEVKQPSAELELLHGLREGLRGHKGLKSPPGWPAVLDRLLASERPEVQEHGHYLAMLFEPDSAARKLKAMVGDGSLAPARRAAALRVALEHRQVDIGPLLPSLLDEPELRLLAIRALAVHPRNDAPALLLERYNRCSPEEKLAALATLASRSTWALALLDAIEANKVPRADLSAFTARQMGELKNDAVQQKLTKVWGQLRSSSAERKALITKWQTALEGDLLSQADLSKGRLVFERTCASCHVLNGQGGKIGPDLTGSNRNDLFYLLENIIDPSAVIGRDYQLNNFLMTDGRLVSGIVVEESPRVLVVQTATERVVLAKDEVEERKVAGVSMMPEGIAEKLSFEDLRDLIAFLRKK